MTRKRLLTLTRLCGLLSFLIQNGTPAFSQGETNKNQVLRIQDNSFLVEEAYNQERGVVQHISTFSRMWNSKDWAYTITQEWPSPWNWRHQLSYSLTGLHAGGYRGTGAGVGDTMVNYRYQVVGSGDSRVAFAPRVSVTLPTGAVAKGRGVGAPGVQTNLPVSVALHRRIVTHWNAGCTLIPHAQNADRLRATTVGYNLGQSVVVIAHPRLNFLVETAANRFQSISRPGKTEWVRAEYISPGVRWAYNFASGLQIVPGVAVPVGISSSAGEYGLFLYLSFEHPFSRRSRH